jgi:membrane protease YdiL (CAAX protease family)
MKFRMRCVGKAVLVVVAIVVLGWFVMTLWNWVVPALFTGAKTIDFLHALGLLVLSRILFGGFKGHGGGWRERRYWRRWEAMTPEEREQFQQAWRERHGWRKEDRS